MLPFSAYIDQDEFDEQRLSHVVTLDRFAVGVVQPDNRLREGDANVLDGHLVVLVGRGDSSQMSGQVFERFVVVDGQLSQQLLDGH